MKGFIKSYADFLGVDSAAVLGKYRNILGESDVGKEGEEKKPKPEWSYNRYAVLGAAALSLLILITIARFLITPGTDVVSEPIRPATQVNVEKPTIANITSQGVFTTAKEKLFQALTAPETPVASPAKPETQDIQTKIPPAKYNLLITARELTWLRITADSRSPVEVLMKKGETTTWAANQRLIVLSGNAGGVELTLNGKPLETLGPSGKMVTKVLPE